MGEEMTILEMLGYGEGRVISFTLSEDKKTITAAECCDGYFGVDMNKDQFGQLIFELQELHDRMEG
jgi:hypothetical protein